MLEAFKLLLVWSDIGLYLQVLKENVLVKNTVAVSNNKEYSSIIKTISSGWNAELIDQVL